MQHIRVAGKYFSDFEIPVSTRKNSRYIILSFKCFQTNLTALWRYMYHMYQLDAFTQSCPADQDIINHYKLQQVRLVWKGVDGVGNIRSVYSFLKCALKCVEDGGI